MIEIMEWVSHHYWGTIWFMIIASICIAGIVGAARSR